MAACNSQKTLKLKPEQKSAFEARTCSVLPTGFGKSQIYISFVQESDNRSTVLLSSHH